MNTYNILAILLIAAGIWGLAHNQFRYTNDTNNAKITANENQRFNIHVWVGVVSIAVGAVMILFT